MPKNQTAAKPDLKLVPIDAKAFEDAVLSSVDATDGALSEEAAADDLLASIDQRTRAKHAVLTTETGLLVQRNSDLIANMRDRAGDVNRARAKYGLAALPGGEG